MNFLWGSYLKNWPVYFLLLLFIIRLVDLLFYEEYTRWNFSILTLFLVVLLLIWLKKFQSKKK